MLFNKVVTAILREEYLLSCPDEDNTEEQRCWFATTY
jgi:hypothetical protein